MSIKAMNWAMHQVRCDGPSAQIVLYVIADTANERGISVHADPKYLVERTRQSRATVFRRLDDLEREGAITRYLRRRRNGPDIYEIHCHLDRMVDYGGPDNDDDGGSQSETESHNDTETPVSPVRPPESHSCDYKSPSKSPDDDDDRRGANVSREAGEIAEEIMAIAGRRLDGAPDVIQAFLDGGYIRDHLIIGARECMSRKADGPPNHINYFKKSWAAARGRMEAQVEVPKPDVSRGTNGARHVRRSETADVIDALDQFARSQPDDQPAGGGAGQPSIERIPLPKLG